MNQDIIYDHNDILEIIPHRPPFLFVESIIRFKYDKSIVGTYLIKEDEPYFKGHFPGNPIMPGVIILDALAQTSGLLWGFTEQIKNADENAEDSQTLFYLASSKIKFLEPAYPGDLLELRAVSDRNFGRIYSYSIQANVGRKVIVEGTLALAFMEKKS